MRRTAMTVLAAIWLSVPAAAQEEDTGSIQMIAPEMKQKLRLIKERDGSLMVVPDERPGASDASTMEAPPSQEAVTMTDILNRGTQDWWVLKDSAGEAVKMYSVPRGEPLPQTAIESVPAGGSMTRYTKLGWTEDLAPSEEDVAAVIQLLVNSARNAVCHQQYRPTTYGMEVDVSAGFGITGRVAFNAQWRTEQLCAK